VSRQRSCFCQLPGQSCMTMSEQGVSDNLAKSKPQIPTREYTYSSVVGIISSVILHS
jgi:hypothetical protein